MWNRIRNACVGIVAVATVTVSWITFFNFDGPGRAARTATFSQAVIRDLTVYHAARLNEGRRVPFPAEHEGYIGEEIYNPKLHWGMFTNDPWLASEARLILPYMAYEGLTGQSMYPGLVGWAAVPDEAAFHLGGRSALCGDILGCGPLFAKHIVILNERSRIGPVTDQRSVRATLVHELIHVQGQFFSPSRADVRRIEKIEDRREHEAAIRELKVRVESHTTAAELEILAAMCHHQDELSCQAFWKTLRILASNNLELRLGNLWGVYEDYIWRDSRVRSHVQKADRFWKADPDRQEVQEYISEAYQHVPYEDLFLPGLCGAGLNTGEMIGFSVHGGADPNDGRIFIQEYYRAMSFDDAQVLLGPLSLLCHLN